MFSYTWRGPTFFRSYGGNLPSSLEESSLKRLRIFSSPTCVGLRYGHPADSLRDFSWKRGINDLPLEGAPWGLGDSGRAFEVVRGPPTPLDWHYRPPARLAFSVVPQFNICKMAQEY
jgi:hypothetical protein